jgi:outer membrane protein OmpA-like peptidoglycan-associated protein
MNKQRNCIFVAAFVVSLTACTNAPFKDASGLESAIVSANAGHYRQSLHHEELANEELETANRILAHWKSDHYWNIDEEQKAKNAALSSAQHRRESEKEMCQWLTQVHSQNHLQDELVSQQQATVYFKNASAIPYKAEQHEVAILGKYLAENASISAEVIAYTDTVGSASSNDSLSKYRADFVVNKLIERGARLSQLSIKSMGEAQGSQNTHEQNHRIVTVRTIHPSYADCSNFN